MCKCKNTKYPKATSNRLADRLCVYLRGVFCTPSCGWSSYFLSLMVGGCCLLMLITWFHGHPLDREDLKVLCTLQYISWAKCWAIEAPELHKCRTAPVSISLSRGSHQP